MANWLGQAGAYAMHARHPSGSQTAAQLAAERANLIKARARRGQGRHTKSATYHGMARSTAKSRGDAARNRLFRMEEIASIKQHARGVRWLSYRSRGTIKKPSISGKFKRFHGEIAPSRYYGRTTWSKASKHTYRKRLKIRSKRFAHVKHWKKSGRRYTPR